MEKQIPEISTPRQRMIALIQAVLLENNQLEEMVRKSKFQKHFLPVILGLVRQLPNLIGPMLDGVSDEDLRRGLEQFRDEFIPFILGDPIPTPQDYTSYEEPRKISSPEELDKLIEADNENPPRDG